MAKYTFDDLLESYRGEQEYYLNQPHIKYYSYDPSQIIKVLARIMTAFEGVLYVYSLYSYKLRPSCEAQFKSIYPKVNIEAFKLGSRRADDREYCFFGYPQLFDAGIFHSCQTEIEVNYLNSFFDWMYEYREKKDLGDNLTDEELEKATLCFLEKTIDWQNRIKQVNTNKEIVIQKRMEAQQEEKKRRKYLDSFVIDRSLLMRSLAHIINQYEDDMEATLQYDEEWDRTGNWSTFYVYHTIIIQNDGFKDDYRTLIGSDGHYPDEEGLAWVDTSTKTDISLHSFNNSLSWILKDSQYAKAFLNTLWDMLFSGHTVTEEDITRLIAEIANNYKEQKKVLKKT